MHAHCMHGYTLTAYKYHRLVLQLYSVDKHTHKQQTDRTNSQMLTYAVMLTMLITVTHSIIVH
jgi:hypothetical protein